MWYFVLHLFHSLSIQIILHYWISRGNICQYTQKYFELLFSPTQNQHTAFRQQMSDQTCFYRFLFSFLDPLKAFSEYFVPPDYLLLTNTQFHTAEDRFIFNSSVFDLTFRWGLVRRFCLHLKPAEEKELNADWISDKEQIEATRETESKRKRNQALFNPPLSQNGHHVWPLHQGSPASVSISS